MLRLVDGEAEVVDVDVDRELEAALVRLRRAERPLAVIALDDPQARGLSETLPAMIRLLERRCGRGS